VRFLKTILIFSFLLSSLCTKAKYEFLLYKSYAERHPLIDSMFICASPINKDTTAFLKTMVELGETALKKNDDELYYETQLVLAQRRRPQSVETYTELINTLESDKDRFRLLLANAHLALGKFYEKELNQHAPALTHYLKAYYLIEKTPSSIYPNKKETLYNIGLAYYNFDDMANTLKFMKQADSLALPHKPARSKNQIFLDTKNAIGLVFLRSGRFDSALHYFKLVYNLAVRLNDSMWMGIANDNMGYLENQMGNYDKALELLDTGIPQLKSASDSSDNSEYLYVVGRLWLKKHNPQKAKPYIFLARSCANYVGRSKYYFLFNLYQVLFEYESQIGNTTAAHTYADSAFTTYDSVKSWTNALELTHAHHAVELEEYNNSLRLIEEKAEIRKLQRNALTTIIVLSCAIAILFINRKRLQSRQKSRLAEAELAAATTRLNEFTRNIKEKNELIEQLQGAGNRLEPEPLDDEPLLIPQQFTILNNDEWNDFRILFEKVHKGFLNRLVQKLPGLTPGEMRFMALSKLRLSPKDMASVLGISHYSIRNYPYRIRKKFNLTEEYDLDKLIDSI